LKENNLKKLHPLLIKSKKGVILLHLDEKNLKNFRSSSNSRGKITPKKFEKF